MKRTISAIIVLFAGIQLSMAQINIEYWKQNGINLINDKDYRSAIDNFNVLIYYHPELSEPYFLRGVAKYDLGDYRGAIKDMSSAISIDSYFSDYFLYRGRARERLYDFTGALDDYQKALDLKNYNPDIYMSRGINYILSKKYDLAIADFNKALFYSPYNAQALYLRALAEQYKGQKDEAFTDFSTSIRLDPTNPDVFIRRGILYADLKKYAEAIDDYNRGICIDSTNSFGYFNRAMAYADMKNYTASLADYDRVIKLDPENDLAFYNRAAVKTEIKDYTGAINDYTRVIAINPSNIYTYFNRGIVQQKIGKNHKAIDDYSKAIDLNPLFAPAYYNRSIAKSAIKDFLGADADYKMAIKINDNLPRLIKSGEVDSTGLAKLIEFKADFESGNVQGISEFGAQINPYPNFVINLSIKTKQEPDKINLPKPIVQLNNEYEEKAKFTISAVADTLPPNLANQYLDKLNDLTATSGNASQIIARAIIKYQYHNFVGAIDDYNDIIKQNPTNSLAYFNRANTRYEMVQYLNSLNDLNANRLLIGNAKNQTNRVQKNNTEDYDEILNDYTKCALLDPSFYYAYFNIANLKIEMNDYYGAIRNLSKAIAIEPKFAEAYYNRGLTCIYVQAKDEGCLDLSKAGELGIQKAYSVIKKFCNQ